MAAERQTFARAVTFEYPAGHRVPLHAHDEHQLVFADRGLLSVDAGATRWLVPPMRALWVPAGELHAVVARSASSMAALYFDVTSPLEGSDELAVIAVSPLLRELIRALHQEDIDASGQRLLELALLDQLGRAKRAATLGLTKPNDSRALAVADALEDDPADARTLAQFGVAVGASARTLQRIFVAETGSTFGRWRTQLRLQHGVVALGDGASVSEAAMRCGYREPSAFIAAFKQAFGTTPGTYLRAE